MKYLLLLTLLLPLNSVAVTMTDNEVLELKVQTVMAILSKCESSNRPHAINSKESHGRSYGLFQYRLETFNEWNHYYALKDRDIMSGDDQKDLTKRLIADKKGDRLWVNCFKKHQLNELLNN